MKQNNRKNTWKAVVAVVLVMASLFAMTSLVSAGFVEEVFEEICETMTVSDSGNSGCPATSSHVYCPMGHIY